MFKIIVWVSLLLIIFFLIQAFKDLMNPSASRQALLHSLMKRVAASWLLFAALIALGFMGLFGAHQGP